MGRASAILELGAALLEVVLLVAAAIALDALERALATPPRSGGWVDVTGPDVPPVFADDLSRQAGVDHWSEVN